MTRKETTKFLSDLLVKEKFSGMGKYYASEVTLNYGSADVRRVDFMQFKPPSTYSVSGIEKGEFICYEVKSCMEDYKSGHGQNFIGEKNYFVMPMSLYNAPLSRKKPSQTNQIVSTDKSEQRRSRIIVQIFKVDRRKEIAVTVNTDRVVKSVDIFKDQLVSMLKVLYPESVQPLALDKRMKGFDTGIVIWIAFL